MVEEELLREARILATLRHPNIGTWVAIIISCLRLLVSMLLITFQRTQFISPSISI